MKRRVTVNSCFLFKLFFQPVPISLSHHCYFTSRAMGAAEVGPSKLRLSQIRVYKQLLILHGLNTLLSKSPWKNRHPTAGVFFHIERKKTTFDDRSCHLKFCFAIHLDSMGANNPPMGKAFDRRGNQGGKETWGELYSTPQNKEPEGGEGDQTTHLPFCSTSISGIGKESKKECKRERKVIMSQLPGTREELVGGYDHEMNCRAAMGRRARGKKKHVC